MKNIPKRYKEQPRLRILSRDYSEELPIEREYDLLSSEYAGSVSESCKRYFRKGGVLVSNNSNGDVSLASIDNDL
jgi:hypothetical protein